MKPYLSIVIPYYNGQEKLENLLQSLRKSKKTPSYEVLVVDDGSVPALSFSRRRESALLKRGFPIIRSGMTRIIHLRHNKGPAIARNRGAAAARGKFLVFLDGDVEVFPDTLANIAKIYREDPDIVALTGVWVKEQKSHDFFPNFKALRDWSYWIHERDQSGYYFLFSTRIASIKKTVFQRLGGFNETYPAPLVEDIELTYRIARRYAIIFAPHVRVRHEFEGFWPIATKYFWRTYYWTKLYQSRKKFDPVATTWWESVTALSGVGALGFLVIVLLSYLVHLGYVGYLWGIFTILAVTHLVMLRKFLWFVYREKGAWFAVRSLGVGLLLYLFIFSGVFYYQLRKFLSTVLP